MSMTFNKHYRYIIHVYALHIHVLVLSLSAFEVKVAITEGLGSQMKDWTFRLLVKTKSGEVHLGCQKTTCMCFHDCRSLTYWW